MLTTVLHRAPRLSRWVRLVLAATCVLFALDSALTARGSTARSTASTAAPLVVAARAVPAGTTLSRRDLRLRRAAPSLRPAGALTSIAAALGRRLGGPVGADEPITAARLLGRGLTTGLPPTIEAVAVPVTQPGLTDLVRAGDHVDILGTGAATDSGGSAIDAVPGAATGTVTGKAPPASPPLAERALVAAVLPAGPDEPAQVVVAVDRLTARVLAREAVVQVLAVIVDSP